MRRKAFLAIAGLGVILCVTVFVVLWGRVANGRIYSWHTREAATNRAKGWVLIQWSNNVVDLSDPWTWFDPPITTLQFVIPDRVETPVYPGLVLVISRYSGIDYRGAETRFDNVYIFDRNADRFGSVATEDAMKRDAFSQVKWMGSVQAPFFRRLREIAFSEKPVESFAVPLPDESPIKAVP